MPKALLALAAAPLLAACATPSADHLEVLDSCRELSWRRESVPSLNSSGRVSTTEFKYIDAESFAACVETFGHDASLVGGEILQTAEQIQHCRAQHSIPVTEDAGSSVPHLVERAYLACIDSSHVSSQ